MQQSLPVLIAFVLLLLSTVGWSADYWKGLEAYNKKDYRTALREWRPLAEEGNVNAQFNLGVMYNHGRGVLQDYKTVVKWLTLAAEQEAVRAQYALAMMYTKGRGVPQNYKTAAKWYRLAAEQGDAEAQFALGVMYRKGGGVPQSHVYAHMWYNIAASQGHKEAAELRDLAAKEMSPSQIEKAQDLAVECEKKQYNRCD